MAKVNLEQEYQLYLSRVNLSEERMQPVQRSETKKAFMAGYSQALVAMKDDIGSIDNEQEAVEALEDLWNQASDFWINETGGKN